MGACQYLRTMNLVKFICLLVLKVSDLQPSVYCSSFICHLHFLFRFFLINHNIDFDKHSMIGSVVQYLLPFKKHFFPNISLASSLMVYRFVKDLFKCFLQIETTTRDSNFQSIRSNGFYMQSIQHYGDSIFRHLLNKNLFNAKQM